MDKFEHKLRTTLHAKSVESIMSRTHYFSDKGKESRTLQPKIDNITTYLRKFQIDRENLNLAKRIMECESEHSRNRYLRDWKKNKEFMRVRSNFKPQLSAQSPKIFKVQQIPGHGRLLIRLTIYQISSVMKLLNSNSLYLLKFNLGARSLIPNKDYLTLETAKGYQCCFLVPTYLRTKTITCKLIKVVENNMYDSGRFIINFEETEEQTVNIMSLSSKTIGTISFTVSSEVLKNFKQSKQNNFKQAKAMSENIQ